MCVCLDNRVTRSCNLINQLQVSKPGTCGNLVQCRLTCAMSILVNTAF